LIAVPPLDYSPGHRYAWVASALGPLCRRRGIGALAWLSNPMVLPWHPRTMAVIHDVNEWKNKDKGWLRTRLRSVAYLDASLRFAGTVVAVSRATEEDIRRFRPNVAGTIDLHTVVNGSNSGLVDEPSMDVPAPNAPFLLSVGRIDPRGKKLPEAVAFVERLRHLTGEPWELQIVGGMNESSAEGGRAFLADVKALAWVHYHGHVSNRELAEWYRRARAVIFLAEHEGFGLPVVEAVSFSRYAVISRRNTAGLEAGGAGVIAIDTDDLESGARTLLAALGASPVPVQGEALPTWKDAAEHYADLLERLAGTSP
ncbi:MAG: glycosyltransferase, partial [Gammaproteobacteria bacterium]|nr:glycosyltransferase [Gammaproteobacteria bacterium]